MTARWVVNSPEEGEEALRDPLVTDLYFNALMWEPKNTVAVLVPCASTKPYREAQSHKYGYLKGLEDKEVDIFAVSDLFGIIPYEWSDEEPFTDYEFSPEHLKGRARETMEIRILAWSEAMMPKYHTVYLALPDSYRKLIQAGFRIKYVKPMTGGTLPWSVQFLQHDHLSDIPGRVRFNRTRISDVGLGGTYIRPTSNAYRNTLSFMIDDHPEIPVASLETTPSPFVMRGH